MSEKPIIFSGPMILALLANRKTQTRRVVKIDPLAHSGLDLAFFTEGILGLRGKVSGNVYERRCPYGAPGDRLFVREGFYVQPDLWGQGHGSQPIHYVADVRREEVEDYVRKPSIYMPRHASRFTLEITEVRVERVQEITAIDCCAEGWPGEKVVCCPGDPTCPYNGADERDFVEAVDSVDGSYESYHATEWFEELWDSINGKRHPWSSNPFVWVVAFKRL
jgi:GNAT superfamily N-acetyltransferase